MLKILPNKVKTVQYIFKFEKINTFNSFLKRIRVPSIGSQRAMRGSRATC